MFTNMSKITGSQTKKTVYDSQVFWQALTVPDLELRLKHHLIKYWPVGKALCYTFIIQKKSIKK